MKRRRRNPDLFDSIRPGDRVTIVDRFGKERTGRARIINRKDDVVVLNMGGLHGTPGIATRDNVVRVVPGKKSDGGGFIFNGRKKRAARRKSVRRERPIKRLERQHRAIFGKRNPMLGIFGANPKTKVVRELGRVVEVRYQRRDDGKLYYHTYTSKPRLLALSDGSIWIKGA